MISILIAAAVFAFLVTTPAAQQVPAFEYLINTHVFESNAAGFRSTALIGPVLLRTTAGHQATVNLGDVQAATRLDVVPTDLGSGRIALRVDVSVIRAGQTMSAKFDVLGGSEAQPATIAARDASGRFLIGPSGMPVYATFDVTTRRRR